MEAAIEPFRGLLLGLFFLGVDMTLDLQVMARNWTLITSGVLSLMAVKALCIWRRVSLKAGTATHCIPPC